MTVEISIPDQVKDFNAHGIECVPGIKDSKAAAVSGYYERNIPLKEFKSRDILLKTGEVSGWLVDVEGDEPEAVRALKSLPKTLRSGRGSDLTAHNWFIAEGTKSDKFIDNTDKDNPATLVEIRADRRITKVVGTHPEGDEYGFEFGFDYSKIVTIDAEELRLLAVRAATVALIARHLPTSGLNEYAMKYSGYLLRHLDPELVREVLHEAWEIRGALTTKAEADIDYLIDKTPAKLENEEAIPGYTALNDLVPRIPKLLRKWWGFKLVLRPTNTDYGNAQRLVELQGEDIRHVSGWGTWLVWDGFRWVEDSESHTQMMRKAKATTVKMYQDALSGDDIDGSASKWAKTSQSGSKLREMVKLAESEPEIPIDHGEINANPWLLNCGNGTLNLKTGQLQPFNRDDLIIKQIDVNYDPDATCPTWDMVLRTALPDAEIRAYLQRLIGYSLNGKVKRHVLPILYGSGANAKSTILNTVLRMLDPYSLQAPEGLLMQNDNQHPEKYTTLFGKRFVTNIETARGHQFDESLIKQLTGGDRITGRKMRQNSWSFDPTHTLFLATNHKPIVQGVDEAIWRRLKLIPFTVTIPDHQQDEDLEDKLAAELPGILASCVRGHMDWLNNGMQEPQAITDATKEYRNDMDRLAPFIEQCCEVVAGEEVEFKKLYEKYQDWSIAEEDGWYVKRRTFGTMLTERGFMISSGTGNVATRRGLRLRRVGEKPVSGVGVSGVNQVNQNPVSPRENNNIATNRNEGNFGNSGNPPTVETLSPATLEACSKLIDKYRDEDRTMRRLAERDTDYWQYLLQDAELGPHDTAQIEEAIGALEHRLEAA